MYLLWKLTRKRVGNRVICLHRQTDFLAFSRRLLWLKNNYAVVPLDAIHEKEPYPCVALTFDDGGGWCHNILAYLDYHDVHATFFVNDEQVATELRGSRYHFRCDVGGHTRNHLSLGDVTSTAILKKEIEQDRKHFAYPYGTPDSFNPTVLRFLEGCYGIEYAWTCVPGWVGTTHDLMMPRDSLDVRDPEWYWRARLAGAYDWLYGKIHRRDW
jgi:peptidoglycan/xylan/chitin deacetylase (PgdA/CDA1 family)